MNGSVQWCGFGSRVRQEQQQHQGSKGNLFAHWNYYVRCQDILVSEFECSQRIAKNHRVSSRSTLQFTRVLIRKHDKRSVIVHPPALGNQRTEFRPFKRNPDNVVEVKHEPRWSQTTIYNYVSKRKDNDVKEHVQHYVHLIFGVNGSTPATAASPSEDGGGILTIWIDGISPALAPRTYLTSFASSYESIEWGPPIGLRKRHGQI